MKRVRQVAAVVTTAALAFGGAAIAQPARPPLGERLASFEMAWPTRQADAIAARARAAAEVMTGQQRLRAKVISTMAGSRRMQLTIPEASALELVYLADYDELRIVDTELAASTAPESEMPQDEAVKLARRTFEELARRQLVNPRHYRWDTADVGSTWVGSGSLDGKTAERKRIEFRITLRRILNDIELANAGIRIGVHTSGRVSSLRLGGVSVASKAAGDTEEPIGKGRWLKRQVAIDDLKSRFEREVGDRVKVRIAWERAMYVMPESKRTAVVEPLYVVSYSLVVPTDSDQTAVSRRKTIGFSLVDPKAALVNLTPPLRAPVIEKTRKQAVEKR